MSGAARSLPDRQAFKELLAQALTDFVPACEGRIHLARSWPMQGSGIAGAAQFPALLVQDGPRIHALTADGFVMLRLQVRVEARVEAGDDAAREALLDEIETQVRDAAFTSPLLQDLVLATEEMASERELRLEGQAAIGQDSHLLTFRLAGFL